MLFRDKFTENFALYEAYHQDYVNRIINIIIQPFHLFTILVWLAYWTPYQIDTPYEITSNLLSVNLGLILILIYNIIYIVLDVLVGILFLPILIFMLGIANLFRFYVPYAWFMCISIQIMMFIIQYACYLIFEKRRPTIINNMLYSFLLGQFYVFMNIFFLCGYKCDLSEEIHHQKNTYMMGVQYLIYDHI